MLCVFCFVLLCCYVWGRGLLFCFVVMCRGGRCCFALLLCVGEGVVVLLCCYVWGRGLLFCFFVFFVFFFVLFCSYFFYFAFVLFLSSRIVFFNHFVEFYHCSVYISMDSKDPLIETSACDCSVGRLVLSCYQIYSILCLLKKI